MRSSRWLLVLSFVSSSLASAQTPELSFRDPPGFYRSASYPPADFSSQEVNASLQVYPFRVLGDVRQAFTRTLLRELVDPRYREENVAPGVRFDAISLPGADVVLRAQFNEVVVGQPRPHVRMVVVVGPAAAIVDASAGSPAAWMRILPALNAFAQTLHVAAAAPEPTYAAPTSADGQRLAGLYMTLKNKYNSLFSRWETAAYYYLFSADGRVYRKYDDLTVPGNDPARFDYAGAQRADPVNSGRYVIRGDVVYVRMGTADQPETFEMRLPSGNVLVIGSSRYERQ
ncbi:hypothetical protein J421_4818 (plasmid) [Gemmatirosa kalamazoonensis]|uniref:Uncharacterized protein n=1 Tax=Gemmatirosa kalamazoonensis TaxID=861299 RepID=W0RRY7_9BACT|nr:hypothetical protein [Gemmatirosa kalamazoonensis]AHG92353.1 hypothetical protein J421_4818 [Gemmatirosa kalamazoonensis]